MAGRRQYLAQDLYQTNYQSMEHVDGCCVITATDYDILEYEHSA